MQQGGLYEGYWGGFLIYQYVYQRIGIRCKVLSFRRLAIVPALLWLSQEGVNLYGNKTAYKLLLVNIYKIV